MIQKRAPKLGCRVLPRKIIPQTGERVAISLEYSAQAKPTIHVGDAVKIGQTVGESQDTPLVHSSVSGKVMDISMSVIPHGRSALTVKIEADGEDSSLAPNPRPKCARDEVGELLRRAGVIELDGSGVQIHQKLRVENGSFHTVVLNGTDETPYVTRSCSLAAENPAEIVEALRLLMWTVGASEGIIAISSWDPHALKALEREAGGERHIRIVPLGGSYTRGMESLLIRDLVGKTIPNGYSPSRSGFFLSSVATSKAVYDAIYAGKPLIETLVTVSGVRDPQNTWVRVGTAFRRVIEGCGGYERDPRKIVVNGPMTGLAQATDDVPVTKDTYGILVQYDSDLRRAQPCNNCARCVDACPVDLMPNMLFRFAQNSKFDMCSEYRIRDCIECGRCAYQCPSKIPLVQWMRYAKAEIGKAQNS